MKNNFAQEYARKEAIIAAYNAAKETGNEAGIEKAKADMRSLNEEIGAKGDAYAFVYRLYREMKECGNEHIDLHDAIHDELKVLGDIYIERDGEITPMADMDWQSIHELANDGLCEVEGGQETGQNADKARTDADKARTDGLTISFPKGDFTEAALANLEKILAAKAGLIGLTKSTALEGVKRGILANAVAPGYVLTDMTGALPEKVTDAMAARIPLGRGASPEEVAETVYFLGSETNTYITGQTMTVDGGMCM